MVGWSLLATAKHHGLPLHGATKDNDWDYVTLGEGPGSVEDHVILPQTDFDRVGPCTWQEEALLKANEPHVQPTCARLASLPLAERGRASPPAPALRTHPLPPHIRASAAPSHIRVHRPHIARRTPPDQPALP
jgi:hypothetical protein